MTGHPNQGERRAWVSRRPPRRPIGYQHRGIRHRGSLAGVKMGRGPRFDPDPARLTDIVPPKARTYPPARGGAPLALHERLDNYRSDRAALTPAQRRRAAHKARLTAEERGQLR